MRALPLTFHERHTQEESHRGKCGEFNQWMNRNRALFSEIEATFVLF